MKNVLQDLKEEQEQLLLLRIVASAFSPDAVKKLDEGVTDFEERLRKEKGHRLSPLIREILKSKSPQRRF